MAIPIAEALDIANRMSVRGFSAKPQISIKIVGKGDSVEMDEPAGNGKDKAEAQKVCMRTCEGSNINTSTENNSNTGTLNSNTVNSKFHLIRSFFQIFARFLSFHV